MELAQFMGAGKKYPHPATDQEKQSVIKEAIFQSAVWSLRSNCKMHPKVLEICEKIYSENSLNRLPQLVVKSILVELKPDKYKIEDTSNKSRN